MVGIIDFGDIEVGDPDFDLVYLYTDYEKKFLEIFLRYFPQGNASKLMKKLDFFSRCAAMYDIVNSIERNEDAILKWALGKLAKEAHS